MIHVKHRRGEPALIRRALSTRSLAMTGATGSVQWLSGQRLGEFADD
jgi:hypothetical protein